MTVFGNVMAAKDLLPKMLELRGRNYTYKQIGEELGISPSLVGKHLKEVRDKPELAFEFIELKNFETGQTVLSFTPENFEKYRQTTILYYKGTSVFEIRSGLIHKTDFGPYQTKGKLRSKLPEWYPMVTKLYSVEDWFKPIYRRGDNKTNVYDIVREFKPLNSRMVELYLHQNGLDSSIRFANAITNVLNQILRKRWEELGGLQKNIVLAPTERHWLNDDALIEKNKIARDMIRDWNKFNHDSINEYTIDLLPYGITIQSMHEDIDIGWDIRTDDWLHCKKFGITIENWNAMKIFGISDKEYFDKVGSWIITDWDWSCDILQEYEFEADSWKDAIEKSELDDMINRLKKLGWTPEMLSDLDKLYEYPGFEDQNMIFEFIQNNDTKTIVKALNSVNYLEQNKLDQAAEYRQWLIDNNWKLPKLKKGFKSYVGAKIYDHIKKHKDNYIDLDELQEIFDEDDRPKYSSSWNKFLKQEIYETPSLSEIWTTSNVRGFPLIIKKPVTAALLEELHVLGFSLDELKTMNLKKITKLMEYLQQNDIEFDQEFAKWAYSHDWEIPALGSFKSYRELRLFKHLSSMTFPSYRLDKMLDDFNEFTEPGPLALSEQELHAILIQEPFSKICMSSEEAGMVQFTDIEARNKLEPIIIEKIVEIEKEVIVKEEVIVEVESKKAAKKVLDYTSFAELNEKNPNRNVTLRDAIDRGDLDDSIVKSITRFEFWAKQLWKEHRTESLPRGKDHGKILMETVAEIMQFDTRVNKNLKLARIARNGILHSEKSGVKLNNTHLKYVLKATEEIISKLS